MFFLLLFYFSPIPSSFDSLLMFYWLNLNFFPFFQFYFNSYFFFFFFGYRITRKPQWVIYFNPENYSLPVFPTKFSISLLPLGNYLQKNKSLLVLSLRITVINSGFPAKKLSTFSLFRKQKTKKTKANRDSLKIFSLSSFFQKKKKKITW